MGKKVIGRPFKKGQSGNPSGRPRLSEEVRQIQALTAQEMATAVSKIIQLSPAQVAEIANDPNTSMLQATIASIILKVKETGNAATLEVLMCRVLGKVRDHVDLSGMRPAIIQILAREGATEDDDEGER